MQLFCINTAHYDNTIIQIYRKFHSKQKSDKKNSDIFHISAQKYRLWHSLEPPRRGDSNVPTICVLSKIRKIMYTPVNSSFTIQK